MLSQSRLLNATFKSRNFNLLKRCIHQKESIRIGCASGFWGDTSVAAPQLVKHGNIDYLVFDYLSEITMSLLVRAQQTNPKFGFAPDFVHFAIGPNIKEIKEKGIKVISNAGGINPLACAAALNKICAKQGIEMKIAVVTGDDLMPHLEKIQADHLLPKSLYSMNAYLGAGPIQRSLDLGADIVITGRCVDSAVTLAPLMHEFKWNSNDYDLLAAGSLAGHLIECGAQVTGGIFTDWEMVPDWENIGFPIVECSSDGSFHVTKPPNTGGLVSVPTVAEQLVYEIGDPDNYLLPDVTCSFSNVHLENSTKGSSAPSVLVSGVHGKKPSDKYKVSATYMDGFRVTAVCPVIGPFASSKGRRVAESILARCRQIFKVLGLNDFKRINIELLGTEGNYGIHENTNNTREAVLWFAVEHDQKAALDIFTREIAPAGTGMAPGLTGIVGGRPTVSPILKLHSFLYPKDEVKIDIHMNGELVETYEEPKPSSPSLQEHEKVIEIKQEKRLPKRRNVKGSCMFPLGALAYTRSGDKGNSANIGVVCRNPGYYPFLKDVLTAEKVEKYFKHYFDENDQNKCKVKRYELPGISAFNFVLEDVLGGGGIASLRSDPQGKALGQMLLDFKVKNVPDLLPSTMDRANDIYNM